MAVASPGLGKRGSVWGTRGQTKGRHLCPALPVHSPCVGTVAGTGKGGLHTYSTAERSAARVPSIWPLLALATIPAPSPIPDPRSPYL